MGKNIFKEFSFFRSQSLNIRTLLITNMLYALILPIIEIFVGAYIMRNTGMPAYVAIYQLCMYAGIVFSSLLNGFLLQKFSSSLLYGFGIVLSTIVMATMMFVNSIGIVELGITGLILGSLQVFLDQPLFSALNATNDANRNYFLGLKLSSFPCGVSWCR